VLTGDRLGLGHDRLTLDRCGSACLGASSLLGLSLAGEPGLDRRDAGIEGGEVTDDVCLGDVGLEGAEPLGHLLGGDVGVGQTLNEQVCRRGDLVVLAGEVLEGVIRRRAGVGTHLALLVADLDEHVALVVDPAELGRIRVLVHDRCDGRCRAGRHLGGECCRRGHRRLGSDWSRRRCGCVVRFDSGSLFGGRRLLGDGGRLLGGGLLDDGSLLGDRSFLGGRSLFDDGRRLFGCGLFNRRSLFNGRSFLGDPRLVHRGGLVGCRSRCDGGSLFTFCRRRVGLDLHGLVRGGGARRLVAHGYAFFSVTATRRMLMGATGAPMVSDSPPG
jgi:hypothetical protein